MVTQRCLSVHPYVCVGSNSMQSFFFEQTKGKKIIFVCQKNNTFQSFLKRTLLAFCQALEIRFKWFEQYDLHEYVSLHFWSQTKPVFF